MTRNLIYGPDGLVAWIDTDRGKIVARWFRSIPMHHLLCSAAQDAVLSNRPEFKVGDDWYEIIKEHSPTRAEA